MTLTVIPQTLPRFYSARVPINKGLWLAVDKVIHHHDVVASHHHPAPGPTLPVVIRTRAMSGVVKHDAEEGKTRIARRSRDETAEQHLAVGAEVLNQRAGATVSSLLAGPAPVRLVNVCEDRAEAA